MNGVSGLDVTISQLALASNAGTEAVGAHHKTFNILRGCCLNLHDPMNSLSTQGCNCVLNPNGRASFRIRIDRTRIDFSLGL